ncbi:MAG: hypothetical protein PVI21_03740 [Candidatus Woesebacteria bacterium]|jgi:hypothetical protein
MKNMRDNSYTSEIVSNGKKLILLVAKLEDDRPVTPDIEQMVKQAFGRVSKYLKKEVSILYIRDNFEQVVKDNMYWGINITNPHEVFIAMPRWGDDQVQSEHLALAINEACYSLVRAQRIGVPFLFGDEVLSRGFAALYAENVTGYEYPTSQELKKYMRRMIFRRWYRFHAGHNKSWSVKQGDLRMATLVGYELAQTICGDDDPKTFCLEESVKLFGIFRTQDILWALVHPKRRRSARILEGKARRPTTIKDVVLRLLPTYL